MTAYICVTCGTQFPPSHEPPDACPICLDERQYVGHGGQRWISPQELAASHVNRIEELEPGLLGIGAEPSFAIGQRALRAEGVLWDCVSLLEPGAAQRLEDEGGVETIAVSHPHYYTAMVDWAERLDARVLLHEADREWIMRPSERIELWSGDRVQLTPAITLIRLGGHFAGGTVCLWSEGAGGRGALFTGDIVAVVADRDWVSFMWSYPNLIPLPRREIERMRDVLSDLRFDRLYGAFWSSVMEADARTKVLRSAERYIRAVS